MYTPKITKIETFGNPFVTFTRVTTETGATARDLKTKMRPMSDTMTMWPPTMLAKRRTDKVMGRIKNEKNSMIKINGAIHNGTPLGINM